MRRTVKAVVVLGLFSILAAAANTARAQVTHLPVHPGIFMLVTIEPATQRVVYYGSAFFIIPDGTALTAAHNVARYYSDPGKYRLVAVLPDHTIWEVQAVCTNPAIRALRDNEKLDKLRRDVAQVHVGPISPPGTLTITGVQVGAHSDSPLAVHALHLAEVPARMGDLLSVVGYGFHDRAPEQTIEVGHVVDLVTTDDRHSDPIVYIYFHAARPTHGDSGAPILNSAGEVVGIYDWNDSKKGGGIGLQALSCLH